jgi:hypothetical protein
VTAVRPGVLTRTSSVALGRTTEPAGGAVAAQAEPPATAMTTEVTTYAGESLRIDVSLSDGMIKETSLQYACPRG